MHPALSLPLSAVCLGGLCLSWLTSVQANSPEAVEANSSAAVESASRATGEASPEPLHLTTAERVRAIGNTAMLTAEVQRVLRPSPAFSAIQDPEPGSWLAKYREPGQTFDAFVESRPNRVSDERHRLYLLPIGDFNHRFYPAFDALAEFAEIYFGLDVEVMPTRTVEALNLVERHTESGRQLKTSSVLGLLAKDVPTDAYAVLAITDEDLFPHEDWSYAFGAASLHGRVAVQSLARLDPGLEGHWLGTTSKRRRVILGRALKVMTHELGHVFGFEHCVYYECVMGGSDSLAELSESPLHLCPVCLHKLLWANSADAMRRYRRLEAFYRRRGFLEEAAWLAQRRTAMESPQ
jgi:archaemetzincin